MEQISTIDELLCQLREPNIEKEAVFADFLLEAKRLFGLEEELDVISLDALLIQAIIYCVFHSMEEPPEIDEDKAKKRDSYLLALGLLYGYYHTRDDGTHYKASARHKQYLIDSDYIVISRSKLGPAKNVNIDDAQSEPRRGLSTADRRCRKELAQFLSKKEMCLNFLEKGKEKFIKEDEYGKKYINLPKPCYTLENFSLKNMESESGSVDNPAGENSITQKENELRSSAAESIPIYTPYQNNTSAKAEYKKKSEKEASINSSKDTGLEFIWLYTIIFMLIILCTLLAKTVYNHSISLPTLFSGNDSVEEHKSLDVDSIEILNKNIRLVPGEDAYLEIEIEPDNIQRDDLEYTSSNRAVVTTEKYHIIAHEGWQEDAEHDITITVQGGLMAEDKAHIIITNPNNDVMQGTKGEGGYID